MSGLKRDNETSCNILYRGSRRCCEGRCREVETFDPVSVVDAFTFDHVVHYLTAVSLLTHDVRCLFTALTRPFTRPLPAFSPPDDCSNFLE